MYVPKRGDVVWLSFDPTKGREQRGHRPALVVSPQKYNAATNLALMCPITSRVKGYPGEVVLPQGLEVEGAVLADHLRSVDWKVRQADYFCAVPKNVLLAVWQRQRLLLEFAP